jgi:hypothetical protein
VDTIAIINLAAITLFIVLIGLFILTPEEFAGEHGEESMLSLLG